MEGSWCYVCEGDVYGLSLMFDLLVREKVGR